MRWNKFSQLTKRFRDEIDADIPVSEQILVKEELIVSSSNEVEGEIIMREGNKRRMVVLDQQPAIV